MKKKATPSLIFLSFILDQLHNKLASLVLGMLHAEFDSPASAGFVGRRKVSIDAGGAEIAAVHRARNVSDGIAAMVQTDDVATGDHLP